MSDYRDGILGYIHEDLSKLSHSELGKVYKFIRTKIIANLPNSEQEEPPSHSTQHAKGASLCDGCHVESCDMRGEAVECSGREC